MTYEPTWTREAPTQPGFYWVRAAGLPEVVHVDSYAIGDNEGLLVWCLGEDGWLKVKECTGWRWWPEPIVPPYVEGDW
jgi:hypothetical protein